MKCGDRGPSGLKEEEILEKTPFPLLPSCLYHIRGASNLTKKNFKTSYITSLHVDRHVTRVKRVGGGGARAYNRKFTVFYYLHAEKRDFTSLSPCLFLKGQGRV